MKIMNHENHTTSILKSNKYTSNYQSWKSRYFCMTIHKALMRNIPPIFLHMHETPYELTMMLITSVILDIENWLKIKIQKQCHKFFWDFGKNESWNRINIHKLSIMKITQHQSWNPIKIHSIMNLKNHRTFVWLYHEAPQRNPAPIFCRCTKHAVSWL